MKDRVETVMIQASDEEKNPYDFLVDTIKDVLEGMKGDRTLFRNLLKSFRHRLDLVKVENGGPIHKY